MMNTIFSWLATNWIEVVGAIFMLGFLYLEIMQKWTMWILGVISGVFYMYINFSNGLYMMAGLMTYNVICSFFGIYNWKIAKTQDNQNLPICFVDTRTALALTLIGILLFEILAFVRMFFFDGNPFTSIDTIFIFTMDVQVTVLSVIALWMAAKKMVESWFLWLVVNPCNILLYAYKGMYPSSILYVIFTVAAIIGYIQWRKTALAQKA